MTSANNDPKWTPAFMEQFAREWLKHDILLPTLRTDGMSKHRIKALRSVARRDMFAALGIPQHRPWQKHFLGLYKRMITKMIASVQAKNMAKALKAAPPWVRDFDPHFGVINKVLKDNRLRAEQKLKANPLQAGSHRSQLLESILRGMWTELKRLLAEGHQDDIMDRAIEAVAAENGYATELVNTTWDSAKKVALQKLQFLQETGDRLAAGSAIDLTASDWLAVDLLVAFDPGVALINQESLKDYNQLSTLTTLFSLAQIYHLDAWLTGTDPTADYQATWQMAMLDYIQRGFSTSMVVLQRRWYELVQLSRNRLSWFLTRNIAVPPICRQLALRFPSLVTMPLPAWAELVRARRLVTPDYSRGGHTPSELARSNVRPLQGPCDQSEDDDIFLIENDIETIDLDGLDSDDEDKLIIDERLKREKIKLEQRKRQVMEDINKMENILQKEFFENRKQVICTKLGKELDSQPKNIVTHQDKQIDSESNSVTSIDWSLFHKNNKEQTAPVSENCIEIESESLDKLTNQTTVSLKAEIDTTENDILQQSVKEPETNTEKEDSTHKPIEETSTVNIENISKVQSCFSVFEQLDPSYMDTKIIFSDDEDECNIIEPLNPIHDDNRITSQEDYIPNTPKEHIKEQSAIKTEHDLSNENEAINDRIVKIKEEIGIINLDTDDSDCEIITNVVNTEKEYLQNDKDINQPTSSTTATKQNLTNKKRIGPKSFLQNGVEDESNKKKRIGPKSFMSSFECLERLTFEDENYSSETNSDKPTDKDQSISSIARNFEDKEKTFKKEITSDDEDSNLVIAENNENQEINKEPIIDINEKDVSSDEDSNLIIAETNEQQEISKEPDIDTKKKRVSSQSKITPGDKNSIIEENSDNQEIKKETNVDINEKNDSSKYVSSDDEDSNLVIVENNKQESEQETDIVNKKSISSNLEKASDDEGSNLIISENNNQELKKETDIDVNKKNVSSNLEMTSDDDDSNLVIAENNEQQEINKEPDIDIKSQLEMSPCDKNSIIEEISEQQEIKEDPNVDINEKNDSSKLFLFFNVSSDDEDSNLVIVENNKKENKQETDMINKKSVSSNFEITSDDEDSNLFLSKNNEEEIKKETDKDVKNNGVLSNLEIASDDEGSNLIISENTKQEVEIETNVDVNKKNVYTNLEMTSDDDDQNLVIAENNGQPEINKETDIDIKKKTVYSILDITSDDGDPNLINEKNVASKPEFEKDAIDKENSDNIESKVMLNAVSNIKTSVENINNTQEGLTTGKSLSRERLSFEDEHTNIYHSLNDKKAFVAMKTDENSLASNKEDLTNVNKEQSHSEIVHKEEIIETNFGKEEKRESPIDYDSEVGDTSAMEESSTSFDIDKLLLPAQVPLHRIDDNTIDFAIVDSNLPHKRLKSGLRPTGWELSRKRSYNQRGLPMNPGLKNLDANFVIKNGSLFASLKPVTVNLERLPNDIAIVDYLPQPNLPHKRLKPGLRPTGWESRKRSYNQRALPKKLDVDFVIKNANLLASLKPVTVELERLPLDVFEGYLEEQQASDPEDQEWLPRKMVRLPNIDEVRRINRGLATAQVRPLVTYPGKKKIVPIVDVDSDSSSYTEEEPDPPIQTMTSVDNTLTPQELDEVLKKLKVLRKDDPNHAALKVPRQHRDYCCTARRHINYNRARARIAARAGRTVQVVGIHARAGKSHAALICGCCCLNAMLGQETSSVRLAHDLRTLDNDLRRLADNKNKQGTSNQRRLSTEGAFATEATALPTQPPVYSDEEVLSATAKERRKAYSKRRHQDKRKREQEKEERKRKIKEQEEKQENEYDEWMRQRNICAKYFTLNLSNNTTSKRPKYSVKARPGRDSPPTKDTPTLTKEMVERYQQMHKKPADKLVEANETAKEKVDAEQTNTLMVERYQQMHKKPADKLVEANETAKEKVDAEQTNTLKHDKNETKVSKNIVSEVVNNIRKDHCYIKDPPVAIEPENKPQSTPPPFATIEIRPITVNRPSIQLITSQKTDFDRQIETDNEEPKTRPSGCRSRKSSLEELCEVVTSDLMKHIDNQPLDPIDKPVDQQLEQTCPRYVIKSAPTGDGRPPTLILQPLPVDSSREPSSTSKEIQLITLPDTVTSTQPVLSQEQVSVSEQTITLADIENQLKQRSKSWTPTPIDKLDSIRQPQLKAMIKKSRAHPGKKFMRILQTPNNDATVLATCTSNPDDPKQSTLRLRVVEQPTHQSTQNPVSNQLNQPVQPTSQTAQNQVPIQLNQLVQPTRQTTQNTVPRELNEFIQSTQNPVPNQLNQPIQSTSQLNPIQLNQSIQQTNQVNTSPTASQVSPTSQTVKMIKTRIIIDVHSIDAGQGTPSEKNLQELLNKYCPQRTSVPPALINTNKQTDENDIIEINDDDEEINATTDKSMPTIIQVSSLSTDGPNNPSTTAKQINLEDKGISMPLLSTSVDENAIIQNPAESKQDSVIQPSPSTSRQDNVSIQSLPRSSQGNVFVQNRLIPAQGNVLTPVPSTSVQGNVSILGPSTYTQGNVSILDPSTYTQGNVSILDPSTYTQGNVSILDPSTSTQGNVLIPCPSSGNVLMPVPSTSSQHNVIIPTSTQGNVFILDPSVSTPGNLLIPSPSISNQGNVLIPSPSIPTQGNVSIPDFTPLQANAFNPVPSFIRVVQLPPVATPIIVAPQPPGTSGASSSPSASAPQKSQHDNIQQSPCKLKVQLQSKKAQDDQWPIENAVTRRPFFSTDLSNEPPLHVEELVQHIKDFRVPPSDVKILSVNTTKPLLKLRNHFLVVTDKISSMIGYPKFWTLNPSLNFSQIIFKKRLDPRKFSVSDKNDSEASTSNSNSGSRLKVKSFAKLPGTENALNDDSSVTKQEAADPNELLVDRKDFMYADDKCFRKLEDKPLLYASVFKVVSDLSKVEWLARQGAPLYLVNMKAVQTGVGWRLLPVQRREVLVDNRRVIDLTCQYRSAKGPIRDLVRMLNTPFDQFGEPRPLRPGATFTSLTRGVTGTGSAGAAPGDVIDVDADADAGA